jgi:FKBP-type peptidyl-prolyl cis-trans isomerase SlyD
MADLTVEKDLVISMDYELKVESSIIDYSEEGDPIVFLQGHGNIIPGLEKAIQGMKIGDSKEVFVKAADGYGEFDPETLPKFQELSFLKKFHSKSVQKLVSTMKMAKNYPLILRKLM